MEKKQEEADMNNVDELVKMGIKYSLQELYKVKACMLCQMTRANWKLKGGDTRIFHKIICSRKKFEFYSTPILS